MKVKVGACRTPSVEQMPIEVVERKGLGHPDTICDAIAETLSCALTRFYVEHSGRVLHHNVDKVLLRGGASRPAFGGGEVLAPIDIYIAGRATVQFEGAAGGMSESGRVPVEELAVSSAGQWLRQNLRALDPQRHVNIHPLVRAGSSDLSELFSRGAGTAALANDTAVGAGYAPLSELERSVLAVERGIRRAALEGPHPEIGEDIKVMGVRQGDALRLTVACAFLSRYIGSMDEYLAARRRLHDLVADFVQSTTRMQALIDVNAADAPERDSIYLTVTGTSAEAGDDGETGRGNRVNGLITPYRPMTLEAAAGKNPLTHTGKLYQVAAHRIAEALVAELEDVVAAECYLVSQIGRPIDDPLVADVRIRAPGVRWAAKLDRQVTAVVREQLGRLEHLWEEGLTGSLMLF